MIKSTKDKQQGFIDMNASSGTIQGEHFLPQTENINPSPDFCGTGRRPLVTQEEHFWPRDENVNPSPDFCGTGRRPSLFLRPEEQLIELVEEINTINKNSYEHKLKLGELIEFLNNHPEVNLNFRDSEGKTPLHHCHDADCVQELVSHGADVNVIDRNGRTPLHEWASKDSNVVRVLIEHGAHVNAKDNDGVTPLHEAGKAIDNNLYGDKPSYELLIEAGAKVNARTDDGVTPLHVAVQNGNVDAIKKLLEKGADGHAQTNDQRTVGDFFDEYSNSDDCRVGTAREIARLLDIPYDRQNTGTRTRSNNGVDRSSTLYFNSEDITQRDSISFLNNKALSSDQSTK